MSTSHRTRRGAYSSGNSFGYAGEQGSKQDGQDEEEDEAFDIYRPRLALLGTGQYLAKLGLVAFWSVADDDGLGW